MNQIFLVLKSATGFLYYVSNRLTYERKVNLVSQNKNNSFHIYVKIVLSWKCCNSYSKILLLLFWSEFLFYMTLPSLSHANVTPETVKMEVYANRQDFARKKLILFFLATWKSHLIIYIQHINLQPMHNVINTVIKHASFICLSTASFIKRIIKLPDPPSKM